MGPMNPQYNMRRLLAGVVAGGLLLISPAAAQEARQNLRVATAELAKSAKAVVEKEDQPAVRIGRFVPTGLDDSNAGDGIGALLAEALGKFVNPNAVLEISGAYGFVEKVAGVKVVKIKAKIVNTKSLEELKA